MLVTLAPLDHLALHRRRRDKSRMDPRDVHKYRGSAAKTRSAKHKRVGPKPWSKELKRSAE